MPTLNQEYNASAATEVPISKETATLLEGRRTGSSAFLAIKNLPIGSANPTTMMKNTRIVRITSAAYPGPEIAS